jgi:hypothetical protein
MRGLAEKAARMSKIKIFAPILFAALLGFFSCAENLSVSLAGD